MLCVVACGGSGGSSDNNDSNSGGGPPTAETLTTTIPVTRSGCSPFGEPARQPGALTLPVIAGLCRANGGSQLTAWTDPSGQSRTACLFDDPRASVQSPLPLIVFLHPSAMTVGLSLPGTHLLDRQPSAMLEADPSRQGFLLLAPEGRAVFQSTPIPELSVVGEPGWDVWYRQMLAPTRTVNGTAFAENVDAATIDHYVDQLVASGRVDPDRIYVMGWSNGGAMGILYALNRPGVAAAAIYSAADPLDGESTLCPQTASDGTPPDDTRLQLLKPGASIYFIQNACDVASQCPNGARMLARLAASGTLFERQVLDDNGAATLACDNACGTDPDGTPRTGDDPLGALQALPGYSRGLLHHETWPTAWVDPMFAFLRAHPRTE